MVDAAQLNPTISQVVNNKVKEIKVPHVKAGPQLLKLNPMKVKVPYPWDCKVPFGNKLQGYQKSFKKGTSA